MLRGPGYSVKGGVSCYAGRGNALVVSSVASQLKRGVNLPWLNGVPCYAGWGTALVVAPFNQDCVEAVQELAFVPVKIFCFATHLGLVYGEMSQ